MSYNKCTKYVFFILLGYISHSTVLRKATVAQSIFKGTFRIPCLGTGSLDQIRMPLSSIASLEYESSIATRSYSFSVL